MIHVDRTQVAEPAALSRTFASGANAGKTETEVAKEALAAHLAAGKPPEKFSFTFERYKDDEVKTALTVLFSGKCAYCETFYAASQPMDVEHWRPKGEVHLDDGTVLKPGYYWLAASWENLFPSCIDCNRARRQQDVVEQREITLGKANQFPLLDEATRVRSHETPLAESVAIVNPCTDETEALFDYTEEGAIVPRAAAGPERDRALASIRVYALNRSDLVAERREVIRLIDHRVELVRQLEQLRGELAGRGELDLVDIVEEILTIEIDALQEMCSPQRPFAGLARFLLPEP